ncbi:hypothetical protein [Streptomyces sp. NBC_01171]|uniref:hypothetical protein n=1 Tax=Streptomyces sp. NBC_01171 TaxID=2903757 RepID=UPI00386421DE|nr:hypothetical protein OG448_20020 [Streptomyces sp. NBC_01171]
MIKRVHSVAGMALVTAVALSGCGGTKSEEAKPPSRHKATATASSDSRTVTPSTEGANDEVDPSLAGNWVYLDRGDFARLLIDGRQVKLLGKHHCRGKASKEDGLHVISVKCDDGNTDRTVGRVYGLTQDAMTVDWEGFGAEIFHQTKPTTGKGRTGE